MTMSDIALTTRRQLIRHSPELLTGVGVAGVFSTAYLAARGTLAAADKIRHEEALVGRELDWQERVRLAWRDYLSTATSATITIFAIVASNRVSSNRAAGAALALGLTERAFERYREETRSVIGDVKEKEIRDNVAQTQVNEDVAEGKVVLVAESGDVLCMESYTGRYFKSSAEALRKAANDVNQILYQQDEATLEEFYYLVGLPNTANSAMVGWRVGKNLELEFSAAFGEDKKPCLVFSYNYLEPM